tara:strand:+ start:27 stop:674 length:648 start_codon:yes stop_codon:yes gene_type:complete
MKTVVKMNKPINTIFAHPKNPRFIRSEKYLEQKQSIIETPEMMDLRPVLIDENNIILGGHQRWRACKELKWKDIPVIQYTREMHLKSESWTVYGKTYEDVGAEVAIKDNTHYGEFDWNILANQWELDDLQKWGVNVPGLNEKDEVQREEIEFSEYLDESHNYIVLTFNNDIDWLSAQTHFNLKSVYSKRQNGKEWSKGVGRVLDGAKYLYKLKKQ